VRRTHLAKCIAELRRWGNDAHLHPLTQRLAVWHADRWWYVVGGDFERPSLREAEPAPPPAAERKAGFYWVELQIRRGPPVVETRVAWWVGGLWWLPGDAQSHDDSPIFRVLAGPLEPPA